MASPDAIMWGVIFILAAVVFVWLLTLLFHEHDKERRPIIINFDSKNAHGRFLGTRKDVVWGAGGRGELTYEPKDVDLQKLKKQKAELKDEKVIIAPHKFIALPEGTLSRDCAVIINLPSNPEQLDESLKHTPLGLALSFLTVQQDFVKKRVELLQDKIKNRDELLDEVGDAEMSEELIARIKGFNKDLAEMVLDMKESSRKQYNFPSTGSPGGQPPHG